MSASPSSCQGLDEQKPISETIPEITIDEEFELDEVYKVAKFDKKM